MKVTNISGRTLVVKCGRAAITLAHNQEGTFPDTREAEIDAKRWVDLGLCSITSTGPLLATPELDVPASVQFSASAVVEVPTKASLSTALTGTNNDLTLTAVANGTAGNSITLALIDPSANDAALGVVVTGTDIVVNLATNGGGTITSTAAQVKAAIEADEDAAALVTVANKTGNDGTGVVTALAETALTGGLDGGKYVTISLTEAATTHEFEFVTAEEDLTDETRTPVLVGADAAAMLANLQTAINADAALSDAFVSATDLVSSGADGISILSVKQLGDAAFTATESTDTITRTTIAAINRTAGRQIMITATASAATLTVDTGLDSIASFIVQVRTAAGVIKAYDGTIEAGGGLLNFDDNGDVDLASTDIVTIIATGA